MKVPRSNTLFSFALGLIAGAALLFGIERAPKLLHLSRSPAEVTQASMSGQWHGNVEVSGNNVSITLTVKDDGKTLSGVLTAPQVGDIPCNHLGIDTLGNVTFSVQAGDKAADFTGKLGPERNSMTGTVAGSVGNGTWTLARNKS